MRRAVEIVGFLGIGAAPQAAPIFGETYAALAWVGVLVVVCFGLFLWAGRPWENC